MFFVWKYGGNMSCSYSAVDFCWEERDEVLCCKNENSDNYGKKCIGKRCNDYLDINEEDSLYGVSPDDGGYEPW